MVGNEGQLFLLTEIPLIDNIPWVKVEKDPKVLRYKSE